MISRVKKFCFVSYQKSLKSFNPARGWYANWELRLETLLGTKSVTFCCKLSSQQCFVSSFLNWNIDLDACLQRSRKTFFRQTIQSPFDYKLKAYYHLEDSSCWQKEVAKSCAAWVLSSHRRAHYVSRHSSLIRLLAKGHLFLIELFPSSACIEGVGS